MFNLLRCALIGALTVTGISAASHSLGASDGKATYSEGLARPEEPAVAWEFSGGELTLFVANAQLTEILEVNVGGQTVDVFDIESVVESDRLVTIPVGPVRSGGELVPVEVRFLDGSSLAIQIDPSVVPSASCDVPLKYNTKKCGGYTVSTAPNYPCCDNNDDGDITDPGTLGDGNCTWWAAARAKSVKGWVVPSGWGNASTWCSRAGNNSAWRVSSTPTTSTIACVQRIGHVAWVTSVSSDKKKVTVSEQNCSTWSSVLNQCFYSGTRTKTYDVADYSVKFISCATSNGCR